ncbi:glutamine synthetase [Thermosipho sp. 1063]|uniref:type I glutamate--ammonia ligase n=1 Tax=unclassified Thermosipho (in: thermotogales) TaxID=2676525 RepID=UPI0009492F1B|nr:MULTISPECIES: type I glutamate--ammonia ligase [unclassified Thermosipho (in: thermotogales)]ANQ54499.1 glutamine synthetase [Thermosipho sp. 1070]APT72941.1 glutamine synthetase [Thermosipho sp. 1063]OOC42383.1 glutamine synthetase [Thermosipho sp. 1074]
MEIKELLSIVEREKINFIDLKVVDIWGKWRHVTLARTNFSEKTFYDGVGFDASNLGYASVENSDMILIPDPETAFIENVGEEKVLSLICDVYDANTGKPSYHDPRTILKSTLNSIKDIADEVHFGPEYEFHIFEDVRYKISNNEVTVQIDSKEGFWNSEETGEYFIGKKKGYHRIPPFDTLMEVRNKIVSKLLEYGIPVKYHHHEVGTCQVEIELNFVSALKAADYTLLVKYIARQVAKEYGLIVTFMPKPLYDEAGNGMHVHQYLVKDGENIFAGDKLYGLSETALSYIAGLLKHAPSVMAFTNPTTNSYRRLVPGYEAPTNAVFALANRTAAIRIPAYVKDAKKKRIEFRTIDASCNPYLAFSAMILAGIDGIKNKMDPTKEGFGPFEKDLYVENIKPLPYSLTQACQALKNDNDYLKLFPRELIEHWIKLKISEDREIMSIPHPKEFENYFDI